MTPAQERRVAEKMIDIELGHGNVERAYEVAQEFSSKRESSLKEVLENLSG